ncbi:MAG: hypothetical protein F6J93_07985 [Oscillatoria sp. SIO1A7]|nr:hypothetical protein [Oscillatoria sp. SIO1A7]
MPPLHPARVLVVNEIASFPLSEPMDWESRSGSQAAKSGKQERQKQRFFVPKFAP